MNTAGDGVESSVEESTVIDCEWGEGEWWVCVCVSECVNMERRSYRSL